MVALLDTRFYYSIIVSEQKSIQNTKWRKIICKAKRSEWGWGGGQKL